MRVYRVKYLEEKKGNKKKDHESKAEVTMREGL